MSEWTEEARRRLEEAIKEIERSNTDPSVDGKEVADDIRSHVVAEIARENVGIVTVSAVNRILNRIWQPEEVSDSLGADHSPEPGPIADTPPSLRERILSARNKALIGSTFIWGFGIILPIITIVFEFFTRGSTFILFDPIPNPLSLFAVSLVPAAMLRIVIKCARKEKTPENWEWISLGAALVISFAYTLPFIVVMPFAVLGILYLGIGLLPLAPFLSLLAGITLLCRLYRIFNVGAAGKRMVKYGMLAGLLILVLAEGPRIATSIGLAWANSDDATTRARATQFLRTFGSEYHLLEQCGAGQDRWSYATLFKRARHSRESARELYYRVTGESYLDARLGWFHFPQVALFQGTARWDRHVGVQVAGYEIDGLRLKHSRMDGTIESDAAMGYVEWTMEFANETRFQQEARALIELPPGGVVSRVTLWVNGEPREAAFTSKSKAIAAYQKVVRRRRDPLLVTSKGKDRVIAQCFPVPAEGEMKIRLGVTFPLDLQSTRQSEGSLPRIVDRNFGIRTGLKHAVWLDSDHPISGGASSLVTPNDDLAARWSFAQSDAANGPIRFSAARDASVNRIWRPDSRAGRNTVGELVEGIPFLAPESWIVVLDGSKGSKPHARSLLKTLFNRSDIEIECVIVALDEVVEYEDPELGDVSWKTRGGQDNAIALVRAWELAGRREDVGVLWIHGDQPMALSSLESINRQWQRRPNSAPLFSLNFGGGSNVILQDLETQFDVQRVAGLESDPAERLSDFLDRVTGEVDVYRFALSQEPEGAMHGKRVSDHLARLWALRESRETLYREGGSAFDQVAKLAARYQLVTAASGAVVLENEQQYKDADLEAIDPKTAPSVSDSGSFWLVGVGLVFAMIAGRRWMKKAGMG